MNQQSLVEVAKSLRFANDFLLEEGYVVTELKPVEYLATHIFDFEWCEHPAQLTVHIQSGEVENTSVSVTVSREGVYMRSIYNASMADDEEFVKACYFRCVDPCEDTVRDVARLLESRITFAIAEGT